MSRLLIVRLCPITNHDIIDHGNKHIVFTAIYDRTCRSPWTWFLTDDNSRDVILSSVDIIACTRVLSRIVAYYYYYCTIYVIWIKKNLKLVILRESPNSNKIKYNLDYWFSTTFFLSAVRILYDSGWCLGFRSWDWNWVLLVFVQ